MWDIDEYTPVISWRARFEEKVESNLGSPFYANMCLLSDFIALYVMK